jgi:hypothetical protein
VGEELDDTERDTFAAVGHALTCWESVEVGLADLYSLFKGSPSSKSVVGEFGRLYATTVRRLAGLDDAAKRYFIRWPSQEREGDFQLLKKTVERLSIDRHRIAHGLVDRVYFGTPDGGMVGGFALVAPWYSERRLGMTQNDAWGSAAIYAAGERFMALSGEITAFISSLLRDHA